MNQQNAKSRRGFIKNTLTGAAMLAVGTNGLAETISSLKQKTKNYSELLITGFDQKSLPYKYDALEDIIDATTMEIHYSKHAAGYCKNLKDAAIAEKIDTNQSVETLLSNISKYSTKAKNNAGGHFNHEMFWQCMQPKTPDNKPDDVFMKIIENNFGSFHLFKSQFTDAAKNRFGSGWAWLYKNTNGELKIGSTQNQDNPLMDLPSIEIKGSPLLCLDVWEHAYYLKYQNRRAEYIENWWSLVNWNYVKLRFGSL